MINVDGTGLVQLTDLQDGACQPAWSPDGKKLVFVSPCDGDNDSYPGAALWTMNADGSDQNLLMNVVPGGDFDPAWSPDGEKIAFTSLRRQDQRPQIYLLTLKDKSVLGLPDVLAFADSQPAWSPDGKLIAFMRAYAHVYVMSSGGTNAWLVTQVGDLPIQSSEPDWSPDGQVLVLTQSIKGQGGAPWLATVIYASIPTFATAIQPDKPMSEATYSPDGAWLLYEAWLGPADKDIYIMVPNGAKSQPITSGPDEDFDPAWQPRQP